MHIPIGIKKGTRLAIYNGACQSYIEKSYSEMFETVLDVLKDTEIVDKRFNTVHVKLLSGIDIGLAVLMRDVLLSLHRLVGDDRVDWLGFRYDPTLKFSEQVDVVLNTLIPEPVGGDDKFPITRAEFAVHVATYTSNIRRTLGRRPVIEAELDNAANHLLFLADRAGSFDVLNQKEFSYLLLRFDEFYSEGRKLPHPVMNAEALELIRPLFDHVLDVPKKDLVTTLTTQDRHNLCMSYTPYRPQLRTSQGYLERVGNMEAIDMHEGLVIPWDLEEHLSAVCEGDDRVLFLPKGTREQACTTYSFYTGPLSNELSDEWNDVRCRIVLDDKSILYRYNSETEGIEMVFDSQYQGGRKVITTDPMAYYLDMALQPSTVHETPVQYESFDEFNLVRIGDTAKFFVKLGTEGKPSEANSVLVYYYATETDSREGKLSTILVPAIPWLGYGSTFTRPVLGPYCLKTRSFVFDMNDAAVDFLLNYIPLNKRMQHKNRLPIAMSYNAFIVRRVLGRPFPGLKDLIETVTKGGVI
jgi:hypothetical protein